MNKAEWENINKDKKKIRKTNSKLQTVQQLFSFDYGFRVQTFYPANEIRNIVSGESYALIKEFNELAEKLKQSLRNDYKKFRDNVFTLRKSLP